MIATKVGSDMGLGKKCLRRDYIIEEVEQSLRRLQVDAIDLYQSHWDDPETPLEETLDAYARLIQQGKVKAIGASNLTAERLAEALETSRRHRLPRYETLQPQYNLYDRDTFEGPLARLCAAQGVGVITYYSLAAGFLTGKYRSEQDYGKSPRGGGMKKYLNPARKEDPRGARRGRAAPCRYARASRAGVGDCATRRDRADRLGHHARTTRRAHRWRGVSPGRRGAAHAGCRERHRLTGYRATREQQGRARRSRRRAR